MFGDETRNGLTLPHGLRKRAIGWLVSIALHAAVISALVAGMRHQAMPVVSPPVMLAIIEEIKPPPHPESLPPPPPAAPKPLRMPLPEFRVQDRPAQKAVATVIAPLATSGAPAATAPPAEGPPVLRAAPIRVPPEIKEACRQPDYPPAAKRLGQTGTVVVKFLIDIDGSVADSAIETSSGYPRLDDAAREALALCSFKPGTVDGQPERSWAQVQYNWKLN